jgi:hypothetical protein
MALVVIAGKHRQLAGKHRHRADDMYYRSEQEKHPIKREDACICWERLQVCNGS